VPRAFSRPSGTPRRCLLLTRHCVPGYFRTSFGRRSCLGLSVVPAGLRDVACSLPGTACRATFGRPSDDDRASGFQSSLRDSGVVTVHLPGTSCRATFGRPSDGDHGSRFQSFLRDSETLPAPYPALRAGLLSVVLRTTIMARAFSRSCGTPRRYLLLTRHFVPGYFRSSFGRRSWLGLSVVPAGLQICDGTFTRHFVPGYFRTSFGRRSCLGLSVVPPGPQGCDGTVARHFVPGYFRSSFGLRSESAANLHACGAANFGAEWFGSGQNGPRADATSEFAATDRLQIVLFTAELTGRFGRPGSALRHPNTGRSCR
jgi:hypothetical protein